MSHRRHRGSHRPPQVETLETRTQPSASPVWTILGDQQPGDTDDTIVIRRSPRNANVLHAVVNGEVISTHRLANLAELRVVAGDRKSVV